MLDETGRRHTQIAESMFTAAAPWRQMCQEIAKNCHPTRANFTASLDYGNMLVDVLDSTPVYARDTLQNSIDAMLRQGDWFKMGTGDKERDEKPANAQALDLATNYMRTIIKDRRTQAAAMFKDCDGDWVAFGSPVYSWETDKNLNHFLTKAWHPKDCCWAYDEAGVCDLMYRYFYPTAREIMRKIDGKTWSGPAHQTIKDAAEKTPFQRFKVCHFQIVASEYEYRDSKKKTRLPFVSVYIDCENEGVLNESGSRIFNYGAPRYRRLGDYAQGFSPHGVYSLPDARMLQDMARVILEQGEKAVDPPMIGKGDMFTRDGINAHAGGFTAIDLPDGHKVSDVFTTLNTAENFGVALELKQDVRALIAEGWLLNKLYLPSVREMRELEVATRNEEFRRAALPFFTPIESEYHSPWLATGFDLAVEMGAIPREIFPPELLGQEVRWTFDSPLKEVEGRKVVESFFTSIQLEAAAKEIDPKINSIDWAKAAEDAHRGAGAEPDWLLDEETKAAEAEQAKQLEQIQKASAVAQEGSAAVAGMAQATTMAQEAGLA